MEEAVPLVQKAKFAKFDETVELTLRLGVDPKHADQMVRGTVVLPHGLGRTKRVLAIAGGEKQREAQEAGADIVGGEEVVEKIMGGWIDFDAVVATPDAAVREVGGDAIVYAQPHEFAAAIRVVLADREAWVRAGLERARLFSWEETARLTVEAYREAL